MTHRLFIAINFNPETRSQLLSLRDELRSNSKRGNFTLPENLHLTLAFLGECNDKQTVAVKAAIDTVGFEPFEISIDSVGRFKRNGGDIWWAGVHENRALSELHSRLTDRLIEAEFKLEKRKYTPHITLGREVYADFTPRKIPPFGENVSGIDLIKSERVNGKLTYTVN